MRAATTAKFPATLLALADIGLFTNIEDCDLTANASAGAATFTVDDATQFAVGMWLSGRSVDGFEIVQVTAVDLALNQVTIGRAKDGTIAVAHPSGRTFKASLPAIALNQMRDDLIAHATFLTPSGGAWTPGSVVFIGATGNLSQDNAFFKYDSTAKLLTTPALAPEADNTRDLGTALLRYRALYLGPASLHIVNASGDANDLIRLGTAGLSMGAGGASALDAVLGRFSSSRFEVTGALAGSVRVGMTGAAVPDVALRLAAADVNPVIRISTVGFASGAGGASATDVLLARNGSSVLKLTGALAGSVNVGMSGAGVSGISFRADDADANPKARLGSDTGLTFGIGGASATDSAWYRQASSLFQATGALAGDVRVGMLAAANPIVSGRLAAADVNPLWRISVTAGLPALEFGAGGGTALDWVLSRTAANAAAVAAGDTFAITDLTVGSVPFITAGGVISQDNANLFWDNASKRFGIGTNAPSTGLHALKATAGTANTVFVEHSDNTNATSNSRLLLQSGGGAGGDALTSYSVSGVTTWSHGVDNSDSDAFVLSLNAALGTSNRLRALTDGTLFQFLGASAGDTRTGIAAAGQPFFELRLISTDANPIWRVNHLGMAFGAGGATATDVLLSRGAVDRLDLATGDSLNIVSGDLLINSGAATGLRWDNANTRLGIGTNTPGFPLDIIATGTIAHLGSGAGDTRIYLNANAGQNRDFVFRSADVDRIIMRVNNTAEGGANAGSNFSILTRDDAGAALFTALTINRSTAQVSMPATGSTAGILMGADAQLYRGAADVFYIANGDSLRLATDGTTGALQFGASGDASFSRQAASVLEQIGNLAGSVRHGMSGAGTPFLALRAAAADANPVAQLLNAGLSMGAGGASAVDVFLERVVPTANKLIHFGAAAAGTTGVWVDTSTPGVILKDAAGSPHYWRITVSTLGVLTTTDIGTSLP